LDNIKFKLLDEDAKIPTRAHKWDAGADIHALVETFIDPGKSRNVNTGFAMQIPLGYEVQVRPRSGLAVNHGVTVLNSPGTIDAQYRGEVTVPLINHGDIPFHIMPGDRIAQMVVAKVEFPYLIVVDELDNNDRGGGFGSTGVSQ